LLTPVILATGEAESRGTMVPGQLGKNLLSKNFMNPHLNRKKYEHGGPHLSYPEI
jgi:hypothetical protein